MCRDWPPSPTPLLYRPLMPPLSLSYGACRAVSSLSVPTCPWRGGLQIFAPMSIENQVQVQNAESSHVPIFLGQ